MSVVVMHFLYVRALPHCLPASKRREGRENAQRQVVCVLLARHHVLQDSINHTPEEAKRYLELCFDSANALASVPVPTIAAINGPCFGWGLEAALGCDVRLTTDQAKLCFPETRIGIFPGAGGVARLCKLVRRRCCCPLARMR